ncbi:hypothetical protein X943_000805 [Babesia divergens]|uniref:tRNA pseudouridine(55) synthase n=1 Tax=Babesia divergens TaxID=32595 RepID=A0AAD9LKX9_BABDI|nr:hypothetical protein X943_000805 [Babesia divergens]
MTFAKKCIKVDLTENVVSQFNSMWNSRIAIASDFIEKTSTISNPEDELSQLIWAYFDSSVNTAEAKKAKTLDIYKKRLKDVVIAILENEFDTFVSDYQALFRYIDRIYHQDRLLFEQLLRLQIHVSWDVQERLTITRFEISRDVLTFTGFYNKFARGLYQTLWMPGGNIKSGLSVEECLGTPLQALCSGDRYKFMASGREDCDVRTTGSGRKFCVEVYNCKRDLFLVFRLIQMLKHDSKLPQAEHVNETLPILHCLDKALETANTAEEIVAAYPSEYYFLKSGENDEEENPPNTHKIAITRVPRQSLVDIFRGDSENAKHVAAAVKFYGLRVVFGSRMERQVIQTDAENKNKLYVCLVFSEPPVSFEDLEAIPKGPITIRQRNPIRTSHRKSQGERERIIHQINIELLHPRMMLIHLKTQAGEEQVKCCKNIYTGTYVKEFVNGDFGRTQPSISSFLGGNKLYVTHLDVVGFA